MKNAILIIFSVLLLNLPVFARNDSPVKVAELEWQGLQITGAIDAKYSPSGKWLALNTESRFYLLPAAKLDEAIANLEKSPSFEGQVVGFMPSGKILYSTMRGLFTLDPVTRKSRVIFQMTADDEQNERFYSQNEMIIVSENLIISGDGEYDMGLKKGNILRFALRDKRPTRAAQSDGFKYPTLSPSGRYILYEHGGENGNYTDLYDIRQNVNYPISKRFNFKSAFPNYKKTLEVPIAWVGADRFLTIVEENKLGEDELFAPDVIDGEEWLVLCDAATGKIIWKRQAKITFLPSQFQQKSPTEAVAQIGDRLYEISLLNGKASRIYGIYGVGFAVSPDKKRLAFLHDDMVLTSSISGTAQKTSYFLPQDWKSDTGYKGIGTRPPLWSPDGRRLILFGENRLLFVRVRDCCQTEAEYDAG